ncbi:MAG: SRPBCC domain-containing protein [Alphaproteobacteria bacterium]|nr:SRPBCC domain-containing protein [Alphaproteobacteria bacterium]
MDRLLDAPRHLVFAVWTRPEHAARWWGPQNFMAISCVMDVRPGGAWRKVMRSTEGDVVIKIGVYREVVAPERLVFTYRDEAPDGTLTPETLVTVTFTEESGRTRLRLHQVGFEQPGPRDGHVGGWASTLERHAYYLTECRRAEGQGG